MRHVANLLASILILGCAGAPVAVETGPLDPAACFAQVAERLSADDFAGRGIGTEGLDRAADWLESRMAEQGLRPWKNSHAQAFEASVGVELGPGNALSWGEEPLVLKRDFVPMGFSQSRTFEGELVFAGYGIVSEELDYDDYAGLDVRGKVVLALRYEPAERDPGSKFDGRRPTRWSDLRYKALRAREAGAAALVFVTGAAGEEKPPPDKLPVLKRDGPTSNAGLPVVSITRAVADAWLAAAGQSLDALQAAIDADQAPRSLPVPGVVVRGRTDLIQDRVLVRNVVGLVPGAGALVDQAVVVGSHYDHLGMGGRGSMRPDEEAIHNGADDNASGVAALLCGVEMLQASLPEGDRRTLVVVAFTAEESGIGGSGHYVENPLVPLDATTAMVNLDMVGRVQGDRLQALGSESAEEWPAILEPAAQAVGLKLAHGGDGYGPSDQTPFYAKGVPVVHFFSGAHQQYHTPDDDFPTLDVAGGGNVARLLAAVLADLTTRPEPLTYKRSTSGPLMAGDSRGYGAYLGTIPDYTTLGARTGGVLLGDVRAGGPADLAGLRGGDRIVGMAGTEVQNLYDMTFVLQDHRPGETIDVVIERGDATLSLRATLGRRSKKAATPHGGSSLGPGPDWTPTAGRDASHLLDEREVHLADLRQLTFGGENAEAYWSPDGRKLVFQRTPPEGGCDQQFVLDLDTGDVVRWSSGKGRTTCGYFAYPGGERLLYATTEGAGAACPPTPDQSQGYVWPLYEGYELVWQAAPEAAPEPFLASAGYDAEATACMRDGRVVFTSTRSGDLELWVADADGSNLRQLTDQPGYDGGAFFTPDCERIVWRASRPVGAELEDYRRLLGQGLVRPGKLELFSMKADGSDLRQLTTAGAASFGPYPSPDGGVIFSSNLGASPREFDLYRVPMEGGQPEQITFTEQFDGFPMFSPDGRWLAWGSNRGGRNRETNLFLARWVR